MRINSAKLPARVNVNSLVSERCERCFDLKDAYSRKSGKNIRMIFLKIFLVDGKIIILAQYSVLYPLKTLGNKLYV